MNDNGAQAPRIRLRGGRVIDPAQERDAVDDVYLAAGRVVAVGAAPDGFQIDQDLDCQGLVVMPGIIDLAAHLREPGAEHKATIASETRAAAAAGITTLCCPPDTDPMVDTPAVARLIQQRAADAGHARVVPLGALTQRLEGQQLSEMAALRAAGCVGVGNVYPVSNTLIQRRAMEYAATHGLTVFLTPEDAWLRNGGCAHEGRVASRLGLPGIPTACETTAVARDLALVEQIGAPAHFCRLSTARAVRMLARAQYDQMPVSADVAAHQLFLLDTDISEFDSQCHVNPPLRSQADRDGLREGLSKNIIGALCSDHQPHEPDAKLAPFGATEPGISALETLLPLALRLVEEQVLDLSAAVARLTCGPAAILGLARVLGADVGTLKPGALADVCIYDPDTIWTLRAADMHSQGHNTPFLNWEFRGRVRYTVLAGRLVYQAS